MLQKIKDPASALTHFAGCVMAALAAVPLLVKAAREPGRLYFIAMTVFALSMVLLYAASTTYHTVDSTDKVNRRLRKLDHMMIFVLIAGSYTPICLITLRGPQGTALCFNPAAVHLVEQPTPDKGNFFLEPLAKTGAAWKYQIYGQVGLDHGFEKLHGKLTFGAT